MDAYVQRPRRGLLRRAPRRRQPVHAVPARGLRPRRRRRRAPWASGAARRLRAGATPTAREPTPRRADFSRGCTTADHRGHQLRGGRLLGRLVENYTTVELRNGAVFGADGQLCRHGVVITGTLISRWASRQRRRSGRGRSMPRASRSCPGSSMHPPHAVSRLRPEQRAGQPFMTSRQALRALRAGITTVCEVGSHRRVGLALRAAIESGRVRCPRVLHRAHIKQALGRGRSA